MILNIQFDPQSIKPEDECYPAFQAGGMTLKIWALWKKTFITSQHFRGFLEQIALRYEQMFDIDNLSVAPYTNLDEFVEMLTECGRLSFDGCGPRKPQLVEWAVKYWDYFNLSIQRSVMLKYKAVREVEEEFLIN